MTMMNIYNASSVSNIDIDYSENFCNRAKLDTGTHCNYNCSFCYYGDKLNEITSFDIIKKRIDKLITIGITEVDLSGGESSIHRDWFKILDYCSSKNLKISTLSNGSKFKNEDFLLKSKEHGLREILFSVHGYNSEIHDKIVSKKGAFDDIISSIENAKKLNIVVRINCTITKDNFNGLDNEFVKLMKKLNPLEVNFLTLNYWDNAGKFVPIDYNIVTPKIKTSIDLLKDHIKYLNVRYTPYCFMKGYEKYVCNYYQHIYDIYDWNIAAYRENVEIEKYLKDQRVYMHNIAKENRLRSYYKTKECFNCKYYYICDGIEKTIPDTIQLHPIDDEKIKDPNYFRKNFYV